MHKIEERERRQQHRANNPADGASRVPQDLRKKMKRGKAAKGLLHDLEEEIRSFVASWGEERRARSVSFNSEFSDDDIVFIGRNGQMRDEPPSPKASSPGYDRDMVMLNNMLAEKLVFDAPVDDKGASFGYARSTGARSNMLTGILGVGWSIRSPSIMVFMLGRSRAVGRRSGRHMSASIVIPITAAL